MLWQASNPNSPPPTSYKSYSPPLLRGGRLTVPLIHFILTWGPSSHKEVMDLEIQFFHERVTEKDPKRLIDRIQRMACGETPFFPTALSLVFDKLVEKAFEKRTPVGPGPGSCTEGEGVIHPTPPQASTSIPPAPVNTIASSSNFQAPAFTLGSVPPITTPNLAWLKCRQCGQTSRLQNLRDGLRCPRCPAGTKKGKVLMWCSSCKILRGTRSAVCERKVCRKSFI